MSLFKLNLDKLNLLLLPTSLRRRTMYSFCKAFTKPIRSIYERFAARRREILFFLQYDSGKYNIERYLNKIYSDGGTEIHITLRDARTASYLTQYMPFYIADPDYYPIQRAYLTQYMPFFIDPRYKEDDFVVHIPQSLSSRIEDVRASVDKLKLPSYTFSIVTYNPT